MHPFEDKISLDYAHAQHTVDTVQSEQMSDFSLKEKGDSQILQDAGPLRKASHQGRSQSSHTMSITWLIPKIM